MSPLKEYAFCHGVFYKFLLGHFAWWCCSGVLWPCWFNAISNGKDVETPSRIVDFFFFLSKFAQFFLLCLVYFETLSLVTYIFWVCEMGCKVKHWVKLFLNTGARPLWILRVIWILRFAGKGWGKRYCPEPHSSSPVWFQSFQVVIYPAVGHFQMRWSELCCTPTTHL